MTSRGSESAPPKTRCALDDAEWAALLRATGEDLDALTATADDVRRYTVGEAVSLVVNRNLTSSGLRSAPTGEPGTFTLDDVGAIAAGRLATSARPSSACRA